MLLESQSPGLSFPGEVLEGPLSFTQLVRDVLHLLLRQETFLFVRKLNVVQSWNVDVIGPGSKEVVQNESLVS